ncbi:MAG: rRNA maturation RNase YbeY [Pseudomonadota bacterium]
MPPLVDAVLEDEGWRALDLEALAEMAGTATLAHLGLRAEGFEISLLGCDDTRIAALNADFRAAARPTNVLSWPSEERGAGTPGAMPDLPVPGDIPLELGDIAISRETCLREAAAAAVVPGDHIQHLLVHGVLHLLGFDHIRDADAALMERLETEILAGMGIADPYLARG